MPPEPPEAWPAAPFTGNAGRAFIATTEELQRAAYPVHFYSRPGEASGAPQAVPCDGPPDCSICVAEEIARERAARDEQFTQGYMAALEAEGRKRQDPEYLRGYVEGKRERYRALYGDDAARKRLLDEGYELDEKEFAYAPGPKTAEQPSPSRTRRIKLD